MWCKGVHAYYRILMITTDLRLDATYFCNRMQHRHSSNHTLKHLWFQTTCWMVYIYTYIGWTTRWWVIRVNDSRRPWSPLVVIVTMVFHCFSISLGELTDLLLCTAGRRCVDPQWMHLGTSESAGQARGYLKIGLWWSKQEGHGSRRIIKIALKDKKQILFLVYFRTTTRWATYFQESFNWAF